MRSRFCVTTMFLFSFLTLVCSTALASPNKVAWSPCYKDYGNFECGTVQVPLDYDRPNGATISISVVRLPAGDPSRRIGSLFFNPGGPGGSGVDFVLQAGPYLYSSNPEVHVRFDIVGFDPRGISRSTALRCFGTDKQWDGYFTDFPFPITREEEAVWIAADHVLLDACEQRGTKIIDHMSTADVARDLDRLRQAVGDEKLNYVGYSYGTFLGVTYANMFPGNVRALVVDGVLDPIAWTTGQPGEENIPFSTRLHSDEGALDTLKEFFRLCDKFPANCPLAPQSESRFDSLANQLLIKPLEIPLSDGTTYKFTYQALIGNALSAMYNSYSWPGFASFLAAMEGMASPTELDGRLNAFWTDVGFITKRGIPRYSNLAEGFPSVACSDSNNPHSYADWWNAALGAQATYGYFGPVWTYASSACAAWPGADSNRYMGPFTNETANTVLVVGNKHDPATRYQGAQIVHDLLPNSSLLSVGGWGHCAFGLSPVADFFVGFYLINQFNPVPESVVLPQAWEPFSSSLSAVSSDAQIEVRNNIAPITVPENARKHAR